VPWFGVVSVVGRGKGSLGGRDMGQVSAVRGWGYFWSGIGYCWVGEVNGSLVLVRASKIALGKMVWSSLIWLLVNASV